MFDKIFGIFRKKEAQAQQPLNAPQAPQAKTPAQPAKPELYHGLKTKYVLYIICAVLLIALAVFIAKKLTMPSPASQPEYTTAVIDKYLQNPENIKKAYNDYNGNVPSFLKFIFGDERINVKVARLDGTTVNLAIETKNGVIVDSKLGELQDPTIQAEISEATIKRIYESQNPVSEIDKALDSGEIAYDSQRFATSVKTAVVEALLWVVSFFR